MKFYIGVLIVVILFALVLTKGLSVQSSTVCAGIVVDVPQVGDLPVMDQPTYQSISLYEVQKGDIIPVYSTVVNLKTGEIWYQTDNGYIQGWSGYTTGKTQVILSDEPCAEELTHATSKG